MKKMSIAFLICLVAAFNVAFAQKVTVNADKKLNTDFKSYKTFYWSNQIDQNLDPGFYFLNDLALKDRVRKAVGYELEGRGYQKTQQSPDLIVNFRVFDKATKIKGFTGYGTSYWGTQEVREPEDATTFDVKAGTLLVSLVDRSQGRVVWQGFASGLTNSNGFDWSDNKIKQAVNLIFEEYNERADNYQSNTGK